MKVIKLDSSKLTVEHIRSLVIVILFSEILSSCFLSLCFHITDSPTTVSC